MKQFMEHKLTKLSSPWILEVLVYPPHSIMTLLTCWQSLQMAQLHVSRTLVASVFSLTPAINIQKYGSIHSIYSLNQIKVTTSIFLLKLSLQTTTHLVLAWFLLSTLMNLLQNHSLFFLVVCFSNKSTHRWLLVELAALALISSWIKMFKAAHLI